MDSLPRPEIVRCFHDSNFHPPLPAMNLRWDQDAPGIAERTWYLPDQFCVKGPAPERFGLTIRRCGDDSYHVRLLWNHLGVAWDGLSRRQIITSSLSMVLAAMGTDLWRMLEQPVQPEDDVRRVA